MSVKAVRQTEIGAIIERLLALDEPARRELVRQDAARDWVALASTLAERVREEVRVDTARARQLAELAITIAETIGNPLALARSLRAKANALYALDQHAAAIDMHAQAVALFETAGDEAELEIGIAHV